MRAFSPLEFTDFATPFSRYYRDAGRDECLMACFDAGRRDAIYIYHAEAICRTHSFLGGHEVTSKATSATDIYCRHGRFH